jgi:hypothetical protein
MHTLPSTKYCKGSDVSEGDKSNRRYKRKADREWDSCRLISISKRAELCGTVPIAVELAVMNQHRHFTALEISHCSLSWQTQLGMPRGAKWITHHLLNGKLSTHSKRI